jgi:hypothetical protein
MSQIKIRCFYSDELIALANRLGGQLINHEVCDRGVVLSFDFAIATFGEQFIKAGFWYSEFIEVIAS